MNKNSNFPLKSINLTEIGDLTEFDFYIYSSGDYKQNQTKKLYEEIENIFQKNKKFNNNKEKIKINLKNIEYQEYNVSHTNCVSVTFNFFFFIFFFKFKFFLIYFFKFFFFFFFLISQLCTKNRKGVFILCYRIFRII
jgi:hypothetical protein